MITSNGTIAEIECDFELENDDSPYTGRILLSEDGELCLNFNEGTPRMDGYRKPQRNRRKRRNKPN